MASTADSNGNSHTNGNGNGKGNGNSSPIAQPRARRPVKSQLISKVQHEDGLSAPEAPGSQTGTSRWEAVYTFS